MSTRNRVAILLLLPVLLLFSYTGWAQLKAEFVSDTIQGCAPLVVKFRDQSAGNPISWRWEMGDGTVLFIKDPATTYFNAGTYTVKLVVSDGNGTDSVVKASYIKVYEVPVVNFRSSDTSGCFPLSVQFNDASVAMSGTIVSWQWDFGDGSSSTEKDPVHIYQNLGAYNVSLRVRNSNGCVQTLTRLKYITIGSGVRAGYQFVAPNNCRPPTAVQFTNSSSGTGALSYNWDFGDGAGSVDPSPTHTFTSPGAYRVRLVAKNDFGCTDTFYSAAPISVGTVKPDFQLPASICAGVPINILNQSDPSPQRASWTFGDGSQSTSLNPQKTFISPGNYVVKLVSDFGACRDSVSKSIQVLPKPTADFSAAPLASCKIPLSSDFSNTSGDATSFQWNFGDGEISSDPNPKHIYRAFGQYDVSLVAMNALGCRDSVVKRRYIRLSRPEVWIDNLPVEGCVPMNFEGRAIAVSGDSLVSLSWDFGDGTISNDRFPSHQYITPGTYSVKLFYTTLEGCSDSVVYHRAVKVGTRPNISFSALPREACAFQAISFIDQTDNPPAEKWYWDFGDGSFSPDKSPQYTYRDTGSFTITLTVWNNGCRDSLSIPNYITIKPPIARFQDSIGTCSEKFTRWFIDQSIGASSWSWDFGDGNRSVVQNPVHNYALPGRYIVKLTVRNDTCENTFQKQVIVAAVNADFSVSDTVVCKNEPVTFTAAAADPLQVGSYQWDFGDGRSAFSSRPVHSFTQAGTYTIRMIIRDIYGCSDSLVKPLHIKVFGPTAIFNSTTSVTCDYVPVIFNEESIGDGTTGIRTWRWEFGDGTIDSTLAKPFTHAYTKPGIYSVTLTVTDSSGCSDKLSKPSNISVSKPTTRFSSRDTSACSGSLVTFANQSAGNGLSYYWDFGDDSSSVQPSPGHRYIPEGLFDVTLIATDRFGCKDTLTRSQYIAIKNPKALFDLSDSVATCPPLVVDFKNRSENINFFQWNFGDGTTSNLNDPGHFYTFPGRYIATLRVAGPGGCVDSLSRQIVVRGPEGDFSYQTFKGCTPTSVMFTGSTKDNARFVWDFNDGSVLDGDSIIEHKYIRPGVYLPKMILVDPGGCRVPILGRDTIRIFGVEADFTSNGTVFCDSARLILKDASTSNETIIRYRWNFGDGEFSSDKDPTHFYRSPGVYPLQLITETISGCIDTLNIDEPITIAEKPAISIAGPTGACIPVVAAFSAVNERTNNDSLSWSWNLANQKTANADTASIQFLSAGSYPISLVASNAWGCRDTAYSNYEAFPLPMVDAGNTVTVCEGSTGTLQATGAVSYQWTPSADISCVNCATTLTSTIVDRSYSVRGQNQFGCIGIDSVNVKVKHPFSIIASPGDTLCLGESYTLRVNGAEQYSWLPTSGLSRPSDSVLVASPTITTLYQVVGSDAAGCFYDTAFVPITVYNYPEVELGPDQDVSVGSSIELKPEYSSDVTGYKWTPARWLSCNTCPAPVATPKQDVTYRVEVVNEGGCISHDQLSLHVFCNNTNVFLPNTFTPNGDGANDIFYPEGKGVFMIKTFRVFNRWGEIIFEKLNFLANDRNFGWDGTFKGSPASQDVYVYTIDIICENQVVLQHKGNVALLR